MSTEHRPRITPGLAYMILEGMAIDMTGALGGLKPTDPMADLLSQRIEAVNLAQRAISQQADIDNQKILPNRRKIMDKPISQWTLKEAREYCQEHHTASCFFADIPNGCELANAGVCCKEPAQFNLPESAAEKPKEKPIKKSTKISKILGVQLGEKFMLKGAGKTKFWLLDNGTFASDPPNVKGGSYVLLRAIENPDLVIPIDTEVLTPEEKRLIEAIHIMYPEADSLYVTHGAAIIKNKNEAISWLGAVRFPSLSDRQTLEI